VAEAVGLADQILDGVDVHVLGHGQVQHHALVVADQVFDGVAVLLHVGGVGDLGPCRGVHVHVALGQARVQHAGLADLLVLDVVAHGGESIVEQVGGGQAVGPGRDVAQGDGATAASAAVAAVAGAAVVAAAGGQAEAQQAGAAHQGGAAGQSGAAGAGSGGDESASVGHDQGSFPEVIIRNSGEARLTCPRDQAAG